MTTVHFKLSDSQMRKLAEAHRIGGPVTLRLNKSMIVSNGIPLELTKSEYNKIMKGNTHDIKLSASRVKSGGFLPALGLAIPAILGAAGGASTLIKNIVDAAKGKGRTGPISNLNIPFVSSLAKIMGLGQRRGKGISLQPK